MPKPKKPFKKQSKLDIVTTKVSQVHHDVTTINRKKKAKKRPNVYTNNSSTLIPKPKGQVSRGADSGGYNLRYEMGLDNNNVKYNKILDIVRDLAIKHLDMTLPFKDQNYIDVAKVITDALKELPELSQYHNDWATVAIIQRFFQNRRSHRKSRDEAIAVEDKQHIKDKRRITRDIDSELSDTENIDPRSRQAIRKTTKIRGKKRPVESDSEDEESTPRPRKRRAITEEEALYEEEEEEEIPDDNSDFGEGTDTDDPEFEANDPERDGDIDIDEEVNSEFEESTADPDTAAAEAAAAVKAAELAVKKANAASQRAATAKAGLKSNSKTAPASKTAPKTTPAPKTASKAAPAKTTPGSKAASSKATPVSKAPAKMTPAPKTASKTAPAKTTPASKAASSKATRASSKAAPAPKTTPASKAAPASKTTTTDNDRFRVVFKSGTLINQNKSAVKKSATSKTAKSPAVTATPGATSRTTRSSVKNAAKPNQDPVLADTSNTFLAPKFARKKRYERIQLVDLSDDPTHDNLVQDNEPDGKALEDNKENEANEDDDDLSTVEIPKKCPAIGCKDKIQPGIVNDELRKLLKSYQKLTDDDGEFSMEWSSVVFEICNIIKKSIQIRQALAFAESKNWPTEIDMKTIPARVVKLKETLDDLLFVEGLASDNPVQRQFNQELLKDYPQGNGLDKMAYNKVARLNVAKRARPGYYGARGAAVIQSTLYRLFHPTKTWSEAIAPLVYTVYASYVLVPYVAHLLIAEDMSCSPEDAMEIMMESSAIGQILQPEDDSDPEFEDISAMNVAAYKREQRRAEALADGYEYDEGPGPCDNKGRPLPRRRKLINKPAGK